MEGNKGKNKINKVVLVTGGSRGIGAEIVKILAKENYSIVSNYNHSEKQAIQIQQELQKQEKTIKIFKADVSKREEVKKLIQFTIKTFGTIDILINNVGIAQEKLFTDITDDDWNTMLNTNLNSVFYCTQEVLPEMLRKKEGCIINISSIWGITGSSCEVAYSTAKAGINGMTKALAKELGPSNIRVNAIAPGIIDTSMNDYLTKEEKQAIEQEIPLEKIGKPIDIARCVKWLIEDEYTTGQIISVNGGWYI
jgi:3-oxoacyl-[acyl-carrier protein] reductase